MWRPLQRRLSSISTHCNRTHIGMHTETFMHWVPFTNNSFQLFPQNTRFRILNPAISVTPPRSRVSSLQGSLVQPAHRPPIGRLSEPYNLVNSVCCQPRFPTFAVFCNTHALFCGCFFCPQNACCACLDVHLADVQVTCSTTSSQRFRAACTARCSPSTCC